MWKWKNRIWNKRHNYEIGRRIIEQEQQGKEYVCNFYSSGEFHPGYQVQVTRLQPLYEANYWVVYYCGNTMTAVPTLAGIEALSDALRMETKQFGIDVILSRSRPTGRWIQPVSQNGGQSSRPIR